MNTNKKAISIKLQILVPVCLLAIIAFMSNIMAVTNLKNVNSQASVITNESIVGIKEIAVIQAEAQDLHTLALSHIIATDFDTMVSLIDQITEKEDALEEHISALTTFVDASDADYIALVNNYEKIKLNIRVLLAYSGNSRSELAYEVANGDVSDAAVAISESINNISSKISSEADETAAALVSKYVVSRLSSMIFIVLVVLATVVTVYVVLKHVIHPVMKSKKELGDIIASIEAEEGDLTKRITIISNDEIGELGNGINNFLETLQNILTKIRDNSERMNSVVGEVMNSVRTSNDSASDLSAVTEELAATMQEVANSSNAISANADEVSTEVNEIARKSSEINDYSRTMKQHADGMEKAARENMEETGRKVTEILEFLEKAIKESESVNQVNSLTDDILNISSQTNLLALNASIEAARAGDAGRGFAVVASEISQLADSSRVAANNIQEINKVVVSAVNNLAEQANGLVNYMQDSILPEFEKFVSEGAKYKENASYIESVMNDFNAKTDSLKDVVVEIAGSISTISSAIDDGVQGVTGAAESTQSLVNDMDNITEKMDENTKIANDLASETSVFKVL